MASQVAALLFGLGIALLFHLDRERDSTTSPALWIPVAWVFIGASRMVTQWFGVGLALDSPDKYLDGSPADAALLGVLLTAAITVLFARGGRSAAIVWKNKLILLFFLYCAISPLWSDFPLVAFKRWAKALGNVAMVLVVLTDPNPTAAIKRLFARTGFFLIPLSVLLIKYYPHLGRGYSRWTWTPYYTGVSTEKNSLGVICLIFGLASLWRFLDAWSQKPRPRKRIGPLAAHGVVLVATVWLFDKADSATSEACFLLGGGLMLIASLNRRNRSKAVQVAMAAVASLGLCAFIFDDVYSSFVQSLGRDTTLTGRTEIWDELFRMDLNPLFGVGFESFWLGTRAQYFWNKYYFHPNQAHNGYIEIYINLGLVGVGLLALQMVSGYREIMTALRRSVPATNLKLAFFAVAIAYNVTEAAFKVMHPVWIAFLLATIAVPKSTWSHLPARSVTSPDWPSQTR